MVTGEKQNEYRKNSKWILSRLNKNYDVVKFTNGYGSDKPYFITEFAGWTRLDGNLKELKFSNGLIVQLPASTIIIYLGKILETGNLK